MFQRIHSCERTISHIELSIIDRPHPQPQAPPWWLEISPRLTHHCHIPPLDSVRPRFRPRDRPLPPFVPPVGVLGSLSASDELFRDTDEQTPLHRRRLRKPLDTSDCIRTQSTRSMRVVNGRIVDQVDERMAANIVFGRKGVTKQNRDSTNLFDLSNARVVVVT